MGASIADKVWVVWATAQKDFSGPIGFLPEVEHFWSWFPDLVMTCKAPVHTEQEAAQTILLI